MEPSKGYSYEDWCAIAPEYAHFHPDHPRSGGDARRESRAPAPRRAAADGVNRLGQNGLEERFHAECRRGVPSVLDAVEWEPLVLRLGPKVTLRMDFLLFRPPHVVLVDTKGAVMRDDAAAKINVAAERCPWALFAVVRLADDGRRWEVQPVHPRDGKLPRRIVENAYDVLGCVVASLS